MGQATSKEGGADMTNFLIGLAIGAALGITIYHFGITKIIDWAKAKTS